MSNDVKPLSKRTATEYNIINRYGDFCQEIYPVISGNLYILVTNELTIVRLIDLLDSVVTVDYWLRYFNPADPRHKSPPPDFRQPLRQLRQAITVNEQFNAPILSYRSTTSATSQFSTVG